MTILRRSGRRLRAVARVAAFATFATLVIPAYAAMSVLRPPREARSDQPLVVTIVYSGDANGFTGEIPAELTVTLTNGEAAPRRVALTRDPSSPAQVALAPGEMKAVSYSAAWPEWARGLLKIDVPDTDVSPSVVLLTRMKDGAPVAEDTSPSSSWMTAAAPTDATSPRNDGTVPISPSPPRASDLGTFLGGRLSSYEPMYFADGFGSHGENLAKFQVSIKFRFIMPDDPRSRRFTDNIYFGYTQTSLWDMREYSAPFRDTSYKPALFYYVADTGWRTSWFTRMGFEGGYEHESNGKAGPDSRGIDTLFVKPIFEFGDLNANYLTVAPKIYWYEHKADENSDIADYRGYVDLLLKYGSNDGWQLAATLRKGMKGGKGSIDTQFTYPLAKLISSAWGGYIWVGYFNGYGEDILDYNKHRWIARIGFAVSR